MPDSASTKLAAEKAVTIPVKITNTGAAPQDYFVDARLNATSTVALAPLNPATGITLPLTVVPPLYIVPTQTSRVAVSTTASLPVMFDYSPLAGDPDVASSASVSGPLCTTTPSSSYAPAGGRVTAGVWDVAPAEWAVPRSCARGHGQRDDDGDDQEVRPGRDLCGR